MDEDWHAIYQAIFRGIEGEEWERFCYNYVELHKAVNIMKPSNNHKAKALVVDERRQDKWRSLL